MEPSASTRSSCPLHITRPINTNLEIGFLIMGNGKVEVVDVDVLFNRTEVEVCICRGIQMGQTSIKMSKLAPDNVEKQNTKICLKLERKRKQF